jgi:hypothetical protein
VKAGQTEQRKKRLARLSKGELVDLVLIAEESKEVAELMQARLLKEVEHMLRETRLSHIDASRAEQSEHYLLLDHRKLRKEIAAMPTQLARKAANARIVLDKSGKAAVMAAIRAEWTLRKQRGERFKAVAFAIEMHSKPAFRVVTLEAIKNAQTRWNKEYHPAG